MQNLPIMLSYTINILMDLSVNYKLAPIILSFTIKLPFHFQSKYEHADVNSLFDAVLHHISNVSPEYKSHHLRYQLVKSVVVARNSLKGLIKDDLSKANKTYKQFAEELAVPDGPLCQRAALRSLRLLLGIPIALYKVYTSIKKGRGKKKEFMVKMWYPMGKDKDLDVNFKFIQLVDNGID